MGFAAALSLAAVSCTDLKLAKYRDDRFLEEHRYALGEQYLKVGDLKLCYQEHGRGPNFLVLPGLGTNIDFWQLNVPTWADEFHVVALDPPGFGKSDKPDVEYDLKWICDRIVDFMDAKGLQRTSIMGGSMGGHLALLMAIHYPDRVEKLVLMGSVGAWPPPNFMLDTAFNLMWNDLIVADYLRSNWPTIFPKLFERQTELTRQLFRYQMAVRADGWRYAPEGRAGSRALRSIFYRSCRSHLREISHPVLLIWGEHDQIHSLEYAQFMADQLPNSRLVIVPNAGHEAMIDQPKIFSESVVSFLL